MEKFPHCRSAAAGDALYAAHYVCPNIGGMLLIDELNTFMNNTARIEGVRRAMIFAGKSYEDILKIGKYRKALKADRIRVENTHEPLVTQRRLVI